jgi:hypothetical protein
MFTKSVGFSIQKRRQRQVKKEESNNAVSGLKLFIGGQDHKHNRGLDIAK